MDATEKRLQKLSKAKPKAEEKDRNGRSLHGFSWGEWARIRQTAERLERDGEREPEFVYTASHHNVDVSPAWVKWEGGPKAGLPYSQWPAPKGRVPRR